MDAPQADAYLRELMENEKPATPVGSVVLVGAGPGDPGLVTLNALRAMNEADVILHDRLVSAEVLRLARRDATRIEVGKSASGHSMLQEEIHALMLEHARAGRRHRVLWMVEEVVRWQRCGPRSHARTSRFCSTRRAR